MHSKKTGYLYRHTYFQTEANTTDDIIDVTNEVSQEMDTQCLPDGAPMDMGDNSASTSLQWPQSEEELAKKGRLLLQYLKNLENSKDEKDQ